MILIKTCDGFNFEMEKKYAYRSQLLKNLENFEETSPVSLLITKKTLEIIYEFMKVDRHVLKKDYNPLEIHFSMEMLDYFDTYEMVEIIEICNGANYLEYPFLLELCCKIIAGNLSALPIDEISSLLKTNPKNLQKNEKDDEEWD